MSTRISKNIKHLREARERSKSWVSQQLGKRDSTIGDYERGKVMPPLPVLEQYAELFNVYIGDLVGKDLWLTGTEGMTAEEPAPAYGRHQQRVEELLHSAIDEKEEKIRTLRAKVLALGKQLKADPAAKQHYLAIKELLAQLEKE